MYTLTNTQRRFVELERKKAEMKKYFDELQQAVQDLIKENGLNSYFQDDQGIVYKVVECDGKFINFDKYTYLRTKRPDEERGTLSMKEAKVKGFKVD